MTPRPSPRVRSTPRAATLAAFIALPVQAQDVTATRIVIREWTGM